jgi:hypothetical protein
MGSDTGVLSVLLGSIVEHCAKLKFLVTNKFVFQRQYSIDTAEVLSAIVESWHRSTADEFVIFHCFIHEHVQTNDGCLAVCHRHMGVTSQHPRCSVRTPSLSNPGFLIVSSGLSSFIHRSLVHRCVVCSADRRRAESPSACAFEVAIVPFFADDL